MRIATLASIASLIGCLLLAGTGCKSTYSSANRPYQPGQLAPDCRASLEITSPRGEKDVLVILCLSGGGSRATWFSAATMLRLEQVVDDINLLHEVDVISSVSGGSLAAAYYCVSRDPGPYSVVRVEQPPENLPAELAGAVKLDRPRGLLGFIGRMTPEQHAALLALFTLPHDQECVDRLYWLSNHTRAPEVWQPDKVRDLMTRNYLSSLLLDSFSPFNLRDDWLYWTTEFNRSDQMAKIFARNLFGAWLVHPPGFLQSFSDVESQYCLDRPAQPLRSATASPAVGDQSLRWPQPEKHPGSMQLEWLPRDLQAKRDANSRAVGLKMASPSRASPQFLPFVSYRFKDLNPERPYLILNATSATEDDPQGLRFGDVFTLTREDFQQHLNSSIDDYDLAHGVMASSAFPGLFSFVTLKDFRPPRTNTAAYLHVFDGGNADNLGLESAKKIILANRDRYRHFVVLVVDSHTAVPGASRAKADVRNRIVDLNFMTSFDSLMGRVRQQNLREFTSGALAGQNLADKMTFWHINFEDVRDPKLKVKANQIPTSFKISAADIEVIQQCVNDLVRPDNPKLQEILRVLHVSTPNPLAAGSAQTTPPPEKKTNPD